MKSVGLCLGYSLGSVEIAQDLTLVYHKVAVLGHAKCTLAVDIIRDLRPRYSLPSSCTAAVIQSPATLESLTRRLNEPPKPTSVSIL